MIRDRDAFSRQIAKVVLLCFLTSGTTAWPLMRKAVAAQGRPSMSFSEAIRGDAEAQCFADDMCERVDRHGDLVHKPDLWFSAAEPGKLSVPLNSKRQFVLKLDVSSGSNRAPISFVFDTGASDIVLARKDATALGINTSQLDFSGKVETANGQGSFATARVPIQIWLDKFAINLEKVSVGNEEETSLLGMSVLQYLDTVATHDGILTISYGSER